jgi:hypothetical protein
MKSLFWIGLTVLVLGILSLVVPIPSTERDTVEAAGISLGIETRHQETISPWISALMILAGGGMMIAGQVKPA